jgi:predicted lipase
LDNTLFPGLSSSIEVHQGFAREQAKTAKQVLSAVQKGITLYGATEVIVLGVSLGGALALLDSVYLPLHLPSHIKFQTITYGMPRVSIPVFTYIRVRHSNGQVGNQAFADYVDAHLHLTRITHRKDPVPTLPARFLGFVQPSGEIHIAEDPVGDSHGDGVWVDCPGRYNLKFFDF